MTTQADILWLTHNSLMHYCFFSAFKETSTLRNSQGELLLSYPREVYSEVVLRKGKEGSFVERIGSGLVGGCFSSVQLEHCPLIH